MAIEQAVDGADATTAQKQGTGPNTGLRSNVLAQSLPDTSGPTTGSVMSKKDFVDHLEVVADRLKAYRIHPLESPPEIADQALRGNFRRRPTKELPAISVINGKEAEALIGILRMERNGDLIQLRDIDPQAGAQAMDAVTQIRSSLPPDVWRVASKMLEIGNFRFGSPVDRRFHAAGMSVLQELIDNMK